MSRRIGRKPLGHAPDPGRHCCRTAPDHPLPDDELWVGADFARRPVAHYTPQSPFVSLVPLVHVSVCFALAFWMYFAFLKPYVVANPDEFTRDIREQAGQFRRTLPSDRADFLRDASGR